MADPRIEHINEVRKIFRGYAAFQMATALLVASKAPEIFGASIVVSLLAISIPSTMMVGGLMRIPAEDYGGHRSLISFICWTLAFVPSLSALSILLWPASHFAAFAFPATCLGWASLGFWSRDFQLAWKKVKSLGSDKNVQPPAKDHLE